MPVIKSAIKKLRIDKKRTFHNNILRNTLESAIKKAEKETRDFEVIKKAQSLLDKAVKNGLVHKNKAARIKAKLAKKVKPTLLIKKVKKVASKPSKK